MSSLVEFMKWAEADHNYSNFRPEPLYITLAEEAYTGYLNSRNHDYVYMEVTIGGEAAGKLVLEVS